MNSELELATSSLRRRSPMNDLVAIGAVIAAALFTGAAAYINFAEHPARLLLDDRSLLAQWKPSYARGLPMQSGLAIVGGVLGLTAWYFFRDWRWIAGSVAILANWPFTLLGIMPTNNRLKAIQPDTAGPESRKLLVSWGNLHAVRSLLGAFATAMFAWACLRTM
jgi:hypothetical protein